MAPGPHRLHPAAAAWPQAPLGLSDYIALARRRPPGETIQVERREIETRIAAGDHVREDAPRGRRMLKPVAAEAVDQEQSLDLRHRSDDGIRVRRDLVQAGPRMGDRRLGQGRQPLHRDVERVSAEIGYWLAEPFWGRGITTEALVAVTRHAVDTHGLTRIFAVPFAWNMPSCRVLEKAGYVLEARLRCSAIKDGRLTDQFQYAFIADPRQGAEIKRPLDRGLKTED